MSGVEAELLTGACGWQYASWVPGFYPDDMPEEWWLSFYSNEFRTVLVPESAMLSASLETVSDWRDDVGDGFAFFVEVITSDNWAGMQSRISLLKESIAGFVLCQTGIDSVAGADIDIADRMICEMKQTAPVCLRVTGTAPLSPAMQALVSRHQPGSCWDAMASRPDWDRSGISIAIVDVAESATMDAKQMRVMIESVLNETKGQQTRALLFAGGNAGCRAISALDSGECNVSIVGQMRQAVIITGLLV